MVRILAAVVAGLLALLALGWQAKETQEERARHERTKAEHERTKAEHARQREQWQRDSAGELEKALEKERRVTKRMSEIANESHAKLLGLEADLRASDTERRRLLAALQDRDARAAAAADRGAPSPGGGTGVESAPPAGVPAELYAGLDAAARRVGEYADRLDAAGLACEQEFDALSEAEK